MKWSILSEKMALHGSIFSILTKIDGGDVEEIGHFQIEKLRSHGTIFFTSLLILCEGDLDEMIDFQKR